MAFDALEFRRAMGCFATGVTVVTTVDEQGAPRGLTVNAFSSVSLEPALILVCVDHTSDTFTALSQAKTFAVNVLGEHQKEISRRFASKVGNKFDQVAYHAGFSGAPIIDGVVAILECVLVQSCVVGDHSIFIGEVQHVEYNSERPLLYFHNNYTALPTSAKT